MPRLIGTVLRYLWASPTTAAGLLLAGPTLLAGGRGRIVAGVLEIHGGPAARLLNKLNAAAMTLGHVVLAVDEPAHDFSRAHERVHVAQCERWGPLFLPAYALASLAAHLRGGHYYYDNRFERQAYAADGRGRVPVRRPTA